MQGFDRARRAGRGIAVTDARNIAQGGTPGKNARTNAMEHKCRIRISIRCRPLFGTTETQMMNDYDDKRDFSKTPEPSSGPREDDDAQIVVIQKHDASSLHYDFRINVGGVLKSWVPPKGPSTDPRDKRLALPTENHSRDDVDFEGVIPSGEYGAGTVLVWDRGKWESITRKDDRIVAVADALEQGQLLIWLDGAKIAGFYAPRHSDTGSDKNSDGEKWLLVKMDDDAVNARRNPVSTEPETVISGRTIAQIARDEGEDGTGKDAGA